ncbi:hypothetical protein [Streptomyces sp. NPDC001404]|uniref:hypothetical protein n=1 Tax=Streptomyces sp. NPDC001404 TaxID=3364571 RepID=UPI0036989FE8
MIDSTTPPLDELVELTDSWSEIHEDYDDLNNDAYDRTVLDCAARLSADPGGESALAWTTGLVLTAPYVAWGEDDDVAPHVKAALEAADRALRDRPCDHDDHPYQEHDAEYDLDLAEFPCQLADESADWDEDHSREQWLCPRNVAGFARIALDIVDPGSVTGIPPRLPLMDRRSIDTLSAILHGYPEPGTEVGEEISSVAFDLRIAGPEDRPGCLLIVMAVTWYAVSDFVDDASLLDELASALEEALPHFADVSCTHGTHVQPPGSGPAAVEVGVMLTSPGGRALYEQDFREGRDAPLEHLLCPVALTEIAEESLSALRARRDELRHGGGQ